MYSSEEIIQANQFTQQSVRLLYVNAANRELVWHITLPKTTTCRFYNKQTRYNMHISEL